MKTVLLLALLIARFALSTVTYFLIAFGLASLPAVLSFRAFFPASVDARFQTIGDGWIWLGATAIIGGVAGAVLLVLSSPRRAGFREVSRPRLPAPPFVFAALGVIGYAVSGPLFDLWRRSLALLDEWNVWSALAGTPSELSGLILLPALPVLFVPSIEALALFTLIASSATLVLEALRGAPALRGTLLACVVLQATLVLLSLLATRWTTGPLHDLVRTVLEAGGPQEEGAGFTRGLEVWFSEIETSGGSMALRFLWLMIGFALCVPLTGTRRVADAAGEARANRAAAGTQELEDGTDPGQAVPPPARGIKALEGPLAYSTYLVRPRRPLASFFFGATGEHTISAPAYDPSERVLFVASREGSLATGVTRVRDAGAAGGELLSIRGRGWPATVYEVITPAGGGAIGVIRKAGPLEPRWTMEDGSGRAWAEVALTRVVSRLAWYEVRAEGRTLCKLLWTLGWLKPQIEIDFLEEGGLTLDRRLGLALALILEGHARFAQRLQQAD